MKKSLVVLICTLFSVNSNSQNISDALRYSSDGLYGTARYSAMGGAFGALGGDLSAIGDNPASSAVFLENTASVSISLTDKKNQTNYFNTETQVYDSDLSIGQAGVVFVFDNFDENPVWNRFTIGLNYNQTSNYADEYALRGSSSTSIDQYFLGYAQGVPLELLQLQSGESISDLYSYLGSAEGFGAQQAFLGYQSYILEANDPDNPQNTGYYSNIGSGSFQQEFVHVSNGQNGKYSINIGTQLYEKLYLGVNLNSHIIDYRQSTYFTEENNNSGSLVNYVGFQNNLAVIGSGFSAQLGAIAKLTNNIRVGLSLDSQTWYTITEETSQQLQSIRNENGQEISERIRPNIINVYDEYKVVNPGKITGSFAYLFDKQGLISIDYSYKDYSNTQFRPTDDAYFSNQNSQMEDLLQATSSIKVGGEYRWNFLSLRAGFRYEESPFKDTEMLGDRTGFSFGAGYNFGTFKLDAAYARLEQDRSQQLFEGSSFTNAATMSTAENLFTLTASFSL